MARDGTRPPNLILITTDMHRWDAVGISGNPVIRTPHLDRLAREGCWFGQCVSSAPVCVPARSVLLTGYPAGRLGILGNFDSLPDPDDTLPAHLTRLGYRCQAIGKMHFWPRHRKNGFHDLVLSEETRWLRTAQSEEEVAFDDYDQFLLERGMFGWDKPPEIGYNELKPLVSPLPTDCHVTQWCGRRTAEWLRSRPPQPFFLWCSFVKPHPPYDPPREWADRYDPEMVPPFARSEDELERLHPMYRALRRRNEWDLYSPHAERLAKAHYYANVEFVDEQIGHVLAAARETGALDNALVIFTSDHGDVLGDHWLWSTTPPYEGVLRVPLIAWGPQWLAGGKRSDALTSTLDIFPTLWRRAVPEAEAGAHVLAGRPGRDLVDLAAGRSGADEPQCVELNQASNRFLAVRTRDWKYSWHENGGVEHLFDLRNDPDEQINLAARTACRNVRGDLRSYLIEWLRRCSDPDRALSASGELPRRPHQPPSTDPSPQPFSRLPWDLRVPPSTLPAGTPVPWWWQGRVDFRTFLDGIQPKTAPPVECSDATSDV